MLENAAEYDRVWDELVLSRLRIENNCSGKIPGALQPGMEHFLVQLHLIKTIVTDIHLVCKAQCKVSAIFIPTSQLRKLRLKVR